MVIAIRPLTLISSSGGMMLNASTFKLIGKAQYRAGLGRLTEVALFQHLLSGRLYVRIGYDGDLLEVKSNA